MKTLHIDVMRMLPENGVIFSEVYIDGMAFCTGLESENNALHTQETYTLATTDLGDPDRDTAVISFMSLGDHRGSRAVLVAAQDAMQTDIPALRLGNAPIMSDKSFADTDATAFLNMLHRTAYAENVTMMVYNYGDEPV